MCGKPMTRKSFTFANNRNLLAVNQVESESELFVVVFKCVLYIYFNYFNYDISYSLY